MLTVLCIMLYTHQTHIQTPRYPNTVQREFLRVFMLAKYIFSRVCQVFQATMGCLTSFIRFDCDCVPLFVVIVAGDRALSAVDQLPSNYTLSACTEDAQRRVKYEIIFSLITLIWYVQLCHICNHLIWLAGSSAAPGFVQWSKTIWAQIMRTRRSEKLSDCILI